MEKSNETASSRLKMTLQRGWD